MGKARIYGTKSQYVPNNQADQRKKRFKRKARIRNENSSGQRSKSTAESAPV
jgi:hypothetical protein